MDGEKIQSEGRVIKRNVKDSIFADLFGNKKNALKFYKAIHPDDDITEDDIKDITLRKVLANGLHEDLGMLVRDLLIMLAEAQSIWTMSSLTARNAVSM